MSSHRGAIVESALDFLQKREKVENIRTRCFRKYPVDTLPKMSYVRLWRPCLPLFALSGPQSRFGGRLLGIGAVSPKRDCGSNRVIIRENERLRKAIAPQRELNALRIILQPLPQHGSVRVCF